MNSPARILVADDNVQVLALVEGILGSAGYEVTVCEGGNSVVEAARGGSFDLILLDGMMPDLSGFEACELIRAQPQHDRTPIVFLTGLTDDETFEDATAAGGDEVLSKPIRRSTLLLRVRSLLRMGTLREERDRSRRERAELTDLLLADLEEPMRLVLSRAAALAESPDLPATLLPAARDLLAAERSLASIVQNMIDIGSSPEGSDAPPPRQGLPKEGDSR